MRAGRVSTPSMREVHESSRSIRPARSPGEIFVPMSMLFACTHNEIRSPMAEGLLKNMVGTRIFVDSCGVDPSQHANPMMVEVMAELGIDMRRHHPKEFDDLLDESFDLVVSLSPPAQHRSVQMTEQLACEVEYWPIIDPDIIEGTRETRMLAYRNCRDQLQEKIRQRFAIRD